MNEDKKIYTVIGLMSGTSKDGVDVACLKTDGISHIEEQGSSSLAYTETEKLILSAVEFAANFVDGDLGRLEKEFEVLLKEYINLHGFEHSLTDELKACLRVYGQSFSLEGVENFSTLIHAKAVTEFLQKQNLSAAQIDLIGFHGQTVFHRPSAAKTVQLGNGELLSQELGIAVVYDFRTADVFAGGQGAPFAPLYHQAIALRDDLAPCVVINCGGISNITLITSDNLTAFDCGPGNCLVDTYVKEQFNEDCDLNGKYGSKGSFDRNILGLAAAECIVDSDDYINQPPPKSLDVRDCRMPKNVQALKPEDACAALEALTAFCVAESVDLLGSKNDVPLCWIFAGGGRKNPVIKSELEQQLAAKLGENLRLEDADDVGWDGDALEGQIFAYLAVRSLKKLPLSLPGTTGVPKPLTGGKIVSL